MTLLMLFFLIVVVVSAVTLLNWPKYSWLHTPTGFYRAGHIQLSSTQLPYPLASLPTSTEDADLKQQLLAFIKSYPSSFIPHLFYLNLSNGRYVSIQGDTPVAAASVIKLPILLAFLQQCDRNHLAYDTLLTYEAFEQASGSGGLQYGQLYQQLPAQEVARMMIQSSDNSATNMLIYTLGGTQQLNTWFTEWGLQGTQVNNWLPDLDGSNLVSMRDMATVLYHLTQGTALNPTSKTLATEILEDTHNRSLIPSLLPKETIIAHKTGNIGTSIGNSGIITLPDGQQYILAIQVERPFNDHQAEVLIRQTSKLIYETHVPSSTVKTDPTISG